MSAPQQTIAIGTTKITYLPDGKFFIPPSILYPDVPAHEWEAYAHAIGSDGRIISNVGAHLIQTDTQTILVDTGFGPQVLNSEESKFQFHLSGGALLESLKRVGISPADIDIVFYTHLHIDHVGWTGHSVDGTHTLTFPNARYFVSRAEWQKFDNPTVSRLGVEIALSLLAPRIEFIDDGQELVPGVHVQATPGHTPGHSMLVITAQDERLLLLGDSFHNVIGIEHPAWIDALDEDPKQAAQTRQRLLQEIAQPNTRASGIHFVPSAFGRLVTETNGKQVWLADMP
jgi:glyoxylase-like metal-dependent hydrolase (beta-lactamase superfamily II)